tara:strand:+ start:116 stop:289 length:174 start_codon:yes stop_codon:yes gene_type:complete
MYSHFQGMLRNKIKKSNEKEINEKKINEKINKDMSPKTLRKNISNDNFMKFQWAWTL